MDNLTTLDFIGHGVQELPGALFSPIPNLLALKILQSGLAVVDSNLLANQGELKRLDMSIREVKSLPSGLFDALAKLEDLHVIGMNFDSADAFPPKLFDKMGALRNITFKAAKGLELAPEGLFGNLTNLENFVWAIYPCRERPGCDINLTNGLVKGLASLKTFTFIKAFRSTLTISEDFFQGCEGLKEVSFDTTGLTGLPAGLFQSSLKVKNIDLFNNKLASLPETVFKGLTRLEVLNLTKNNIVSISDIHFKDLRTLRRLGLADNSIASIEKYAFRALSKLEELNLDRNSLAFDDGDQPEWSSLNSLKKLTLANNSISIQVIPFHWTTNAGSLERLDLSNNRVGPRISAFDLNFLQRSIEVDLSGNRIEEISHLDLVKKVSSSNVDSKPLLILDGNPLDCSCRALQLSRLYRGDLEKVNIRIRADQLRCESPSNLQGRLFASLSYDDLVCRFPSDMLDLECPQSCECFYSPSDGKTEITCAEKSLEAFPSFIPVAPKTDVVFLNLRGNNIAALEKLDHRVRLENDSLDVGLELSLSGNVLTGLDGLSDVHKNLKVLEVDGNRITEIEDDALKYLKWLDKVKLAGNPYPCDCDSLELYRFLRSRKSLVADIENVTVINCGGKEGDSKAGTDVALVDLEKADFCPDKAVVLGLVAAVLVILVLLAVLAIVFFKEQILVWVYSHKSLRYLFPGDPLESDKIFDAFISYSGVDSEFVEGKLVPELEESKSNLRYKCLVHERDFRTGENIQQQIVEAVERSRRTVVVLSKNFVRSQWYEEEFRIAHSEKRRGIIVVVLGELPTEQEMGPLMWQYIKSNTYLKHDDPWFWDKLRYALPHRGRSALRRRSSSTVKPGFPRWSAAAGGRTDQLQLIDKGPAAAATTTATGVPSASPNGAATGNGVAGNGSASNNSGGQEQQGVSNPSFMGSTIYITESPPSSATPNGRAQTEVRM